jgi:hypothetical protein
LAEKYLTLERFGEELKDIETGTITLPAFSVYSTEKPAISAISCNG